MQITYELSEKDFVEAYGVHRNRNWVSKWALRGFVGIIVLIAIVFIVLALTDPSFRTARNILPFFGLLIFWWVLLWAHPRWTMRRQFLQQPGAQGPRTLLVDAGGAHWRWRVGSSDVEWRNYIRWVQGKNQILFYTSPACFNILPTNALRPGELDELRDALKQHIQVSE